MVPADILVWLWLHQVPGRSGPHLPRGPWKDERSLRWPLQAGVMPEHCCCFVDEYFRDLITHPQMIRLHQLMLGEQIRYDRKPQHRLSHCLLCCWALVLAPPLARDRA